MDAENAGSDITGRGKWRTVYNVGPPYCRAVMYAGRVACCFLVSHDECRRDRPTDEETDGRQTVTLCFSLDAAIVTTTLCNMRLFCSLAVLDPRVGHTMDVLSPFISVFCHSVTIATSFWAIVKRTSDIDHAHLYMYISWKIIQYRSCTCWHNWDC